MPSPFKGTYLVTRVVVWDIEESRKLWSMGFYGKPIGIAKPKSPDFESPLILDLVETLYLMEEDLLEVESVTGEKISTDKFRELARKMYEDFERRYLVYKDLRKKGFVVISGLKFGVDYAVYRKGPGLEHAPFLVDVVKPKTPITSDELVRAGRLATTVRKRFIIAVADIERKKVFYLMFRWWKPH